jgi:hypothetical protein
MAANQDFGPFFAFTVSTRTSATLIGAAIGSESNDGLVSRRQLRFAPA